ncbi:MAG: 2-amino-4-hydroxy-6-hydroxymethyldihydropteridine diphosphokinase [Propionibacteriaceae bacterium]|jgi:2-amino-4-hydroxy-6-hydroxymethyldihydropteridine diphosphokinase|nr:2-amino-4-hydroxy-6-hydroxymethyldihydropteridine diphosphokinase [Propionibacteriaceae bacterium]
MAKVVLALGSNLGDSVGYLRRALSWLGEVPHLRLTAVSSVYRSAPVDYLDQPYFLNAVVIGESSLAPYTLLNFIQAIENRLGRVRVIDKGPRTIDIDIIEYENHHLHTPNLSIPHPRARKRAFVLIPWAEVDPEVQPLASTLVQNDPTDGDAVEIYPARLHLNGGNKQARLLL